MKNLISITCNTSYPEECSQKVSSELKKGSWVHLFPKGGQRELSINCLPKGPGVIIRGGGSSGKYLKCIHPIRHLDQSAFATAKWLETQGLEPQSCIILNSLPLHHMSGLLPWWRSRCWGAKHIWITPQLMHDADLLEKECNSLLNKSTGPLITSLVPIQLHRLLKHPAGIRWLKLHSIIWVGGSPITKDLASTARNLKIRLAPCYGTTETAAMVAVQSPEQFLAGDNYFGEALNDVEFRLGKNRSLQIRTQRLAKNYLEKDGTLNSICDNEGWWESGDAAELIVNNKRQQLKIIGRIDTAINSGGEIIFPEILQVKLVEIARKKGIPIDIILLTPIHHEEWGERLIALVKFQTKESKLQQQAFLARLKDMVHKWSVHERPLDWYYCPELSTNKLGKWEIKQWQTWVKLKRANSPI